MNWQDFIITRETAYINCSAETANVILLGCTTGELDSYVLVFFSHIYCGREYFYRRFEDFIDDLLFNRNDRADFSMTIEESKNDERIINSMVGDFFVLNGLDMDEYNYKHNDEENGIDEDFNDTSVSINNVLGDFSAVVGGVNNENI